MTEYVAYLHEKNTQMQPGDKFYGMANCFDKAVIYGILLERPLELGMFIPCKDGEPLEKPSADINISAINDREQYQKALESVLFEGWKAPEVNEGAWQIYTNGNVCINSWEHKTVEDLITSKIELKPTEACKTQIQIT